MNSTAVVLILGVGFAAFAYFVAPAAWWLVTLAYLVGVTVGNISGTPPPDAHFYGDECIARKPAEPRGD